MNKEAKISWIWKHYPSEYINAKTKAESKLDELTPMICFCGKLATGFHTNSCKKFQSRLKSMIIDDLQHLLPKRSRVELTIKKGENNAD